MRRFVVLAACFVGCSLLTPLDDLGGSDASLDAVEEPLPAPTPVCDANEQPKASALYVSTSGDDSLVGAQGSPFKTIDYALQQAAKQAIADVYVDEGTYPEEITITSATTIHGGWKLTGANWSRDCKQGFVGLTVIRSPTARGVTATGFSGSAGLQTLTLVTKAVADPGHSGIAIFVSGAMTFDVSGVDVTAPSGGDGASPPAPAATGNLGCGGLADCNDGVAGAASTTAGAPAGAGTFDATGYVSATGKSGGAGANAHDGTAGGAGQSKATCDTQCFQNSPCPAGNQVTLSAGMGKCGCGGLGGSGGTPGQSGGASIGIYVVGAVLTIDHSTVRSANGGAGSVGGAGGPGGPGTAGVKGSDQTCDGPCLTQNTQCVAYASTLTGGSPGGKGGVGGTGASGGGGAGGPSYAIVATGGAKLPADLSTAALQSGNGGVGQGGAANGARANTFAP